MRWQFLRLYLALGSVLMIGAAGLFLYGRYDMKNARLEAFRVRGAAKLEALREILAGHPGGREQREEELRKLGRDLRPPPPPHDGPWPDRGPERMPGPRPERGSERAGHGPDPGRHEPDLRLETLDKIDLSGPMRQRLAAGEIVSIPGEKEQHLYALLNSEEAMVMVQPLPTPLPEEERRLLPAIFPILVPLGVLIGLGAVIFMLIRPIDLRLAALTRATEDFGAGALGRMLFALDDAEAAVSAEEKNTHLKRIDKALQELVEMVNEVLSFLRIGESEVKPGNRALQVASLLAHVPELIADLHPGLALETDCQAAEVFADPVYFKRAVDNLLSNAVRYAKTRIRLSTLLEDHAFLLSVDDDGGGAIHLDPSGHALLSAIRSAGAPQKDRKSVV